MKRNIIVILSVMVLILFSGCSKNVTGELCTKLKYYVNESDREDVNFENGVCIIKGEGGNNTLNIESSSLFEKFDLLIIDTNETCDSMELIKNTNCVDVD